VKSSVEADNLYIPPHLRILKIENFALYFVPIQPYIDLLLLINCNSLIYMARILLVDDEPCILSVLSTLLKAEGYDVVAAQGGDKAKDILLTEDFDLMLSDIRMSLIWVL
jgi:hypothetical protein